jgi:glycosyltransferase involved in cell wall biosynthesis
MPVDVSHFERGAAQAKADPARILYAGNLLESKGVDDLLLAHHALRRENIMCELKFLGEGPAEVSLRQRARALGVEDSVVFAPFVTQREMPAEYGAATVTVLPTRGNAEGLGLTLVEALLAGSAIVGTAAGGIPEVVRDEETGLLARDGDPNDLARQIGRLLRDASLRARLTAQGRTYVSERYAPAASARRFQELYGAALAHSGT